MNTPTIFEPTTLINKDKFKFGKNVIISEYCHIYGGLGVEIGDFVHISANVCVGGGGRLIIGNFVNVSAGAHLITGTDSAKGDALVGAAAPNDLRKVDRGYIIIQDYAWVATGAIIMPNVNIGEGAVIGAGAVVTKNVRPWTIVVGNPAKQIGKRPKGTIIKLAKEAYKRIENDSTS
jgi:galactoside O-acetyltransferase